VRECGARDSDVPLLDSSTPIIHYPDLAIIEIRCPRHHHRRLYPKVDDDDSFAEGEGKNSTTHALSDTGDTARASESRPRHPSPVVVAVLVHRDLSLSHHPSHLANYFPSCPSLRHHASCIIPKRSKRRDGLFLLDDDDDDDSNTNRSTTKYRQSRHPLRLPTFWRGHAHIRTNRT
jgi:hypothetical protein